MGLQVCQPPNGIQDTFYDLQPLFQTMCIPWSSPASSIYCHHCTISVKFRFIFTESHLKANPKKGFFTHWNSFQYAGRSLWHSHKDDSHSLQSPSSPWDIYRSWGPPHPACSSRIPSWGGIASFCWKLRWLNPLAGRSKLWKYGKRWLRLCAQGSSG